MKFGSSSLESVCERLISTAVEESALVSHVKEDIQKLRSSIVPIIKAVLQDAEEKLVENEIVCIWHTTLKQLLFDYEDILDELATKAALQKREADSARLVSSMRAKVCNVLCCSFGAIGNILFKRNIARQIKDVRTRLEERSREINTFGLQFLGGSIRPIINRPHGVMITRSMLVDELDIIGRDDEKEKIKKLLSESVEGTEGTSSSKNVRVISIIGMGGVGKTTLVKLVYNDPMVLQYFPVRVWVSVSDYFDVERIAIEIMDAILTYDDREGSRTIANWDKIQAMLKEKIGGKRFLLVLDDMWEEEDHYSKWESLCKPLKYGGKGSKIIVTTRSQKVSHMVKGNPIFLENPSDEHLWRIFGRHAFDGCDSYKRVQLEPLGRQIVTKLEGSPLAAKVVGRLLNSNLDVMHWERIMNNKTWVRSRDEHNILPILKLSYDRLSGHLKQCFAYCSLFPKYYRFSEDELVELWMAQNFIKIPKDYPTQVAMSQHFNDLLHASFFRQIYNTFVMHDLIRDLAESVSEDDCFRLDDDESKQIPKTVRHMSVVGNNFDPTRLKEICQHQKLRTLLFLGPYGFDLSLHLDELFKKLHRLRALGLSRCDIEELPESIGKLIHLRYIDVSNTLIRKLPESICNLHNLQVLKLQFCSELSSLPSNMSELINLRLLSADGDLVSNIRGLGKLTALEVLRISGRKMRELAGMDALRELEIFDIPHEDETKQEAIQAKLAGKKHMDVLTLRWSSNHNGDRPVNPRLDEEVLECLQPANNIKTLVIKNYGGVEFPSWMNNDSFVSFSLLERVELEDCSDCEVLPRLGRLPWLKVLQVRHMSKLRHVGPEFLGSHVNDGRAVISPLEELMFSNMPEWENWDATRECQLPSFLPRLLKLKIDKCPKLRQLPPLPPTLTDLKIKKVPKLQSCEVLSNMSNLRRIYADDGVVSNIWGLGRLIALEELRISGRKMRELAAMDALRELEIFDIPHEDETKQEAIQAKLGGKKHLDVLTLRWRSNDDGDTLVDPRLDEEVLECLQPANNIKTLVIKNYGGVKFPSWMNDDSCVSFSSLERVELEDCSDCEALPRLGQLPFLKVLKVSGLSKLRHVGPQFLDSYVNDGGAVISHEYFPSLEKLVFYNMPEWEEWDDGHLLFLPRLLKLKIDKCPKLRQLPPLPPTLTDLTLGKVGLTHLPGCLGLPSSSPSLPSLKIINCPNLASLPGEVLLQQPVQNLVDLEIQDCENLVSLPERAPLSPSAVTVMRPETLRILGRSPEQIKALLLHWNFLQTLEIGWCDELIWFDGDGGDDIGRELEAALLNLAPSLRSLGFSHCENLCSLPSKLRQLSSLRDLQIYGCPKIRCLPSAGLPESLVSLDIFRCPRLEQRCKRGRGPDWPLISHIRNITTDR